MHTRSARYDGASEGGEGAVWRLLLLAIEHIETTSRHLYNNSPLPDPTQHVVLHYSGSKMTDTTEEWVDGEGYISDESSFYGTARSSTKHPIQVPKTLDSTDKIPSQATTNSAYISKSKPPISHLQPTGPPNTSASPQSPPQTSLLPHAKQRKKQTSSSTTRTKVNPPHANSPNPSLSSSLVYRRLLASYRRSDHGFMSRIRTRPIDR